MRGIPEDCGLNSCPVPCGCGEQPLKTTLLQEASRPFRACQALKGQTTPASCRRTATRRNLSQKPAVPEIRLSRSPVQQFSGASEGFRVHPAPHGLYGANFGLIWRSAGSTAARCCFSTRNAGADQRVQSRIQELASVRLRYPRVADQHASLPQAAMIPESAPQAVRLDRGYPTTLRCFPKRVFWRCSSLISADLRPPEKRPRLCENTGWIRGKEISFYVVRFPQDMCSTRSLFGGGCRRKSRAFRWRSSFHTVSAVCRTQAGTLSGHSRLHLHHRARSGRAVVH